MKSSNIRKLVAITFLVCLTAVPAFSQNSSNVSSPVQVPDTVSQNKETAIYGEVQTVNGPSGVLAVQYYDYDSDSEKTTDIATGPDTKLENASAIGDIKKGDWVDVTYIVKDGKNTAKIVTVEKEETPANDEESPQAVAPATVPSEQ